jgi:hypothetical protein
MGAPPNWVAAPEKSHWWAESRCPDVDRDETVWAPDRAGDTRECQILDPFNDPYQRDSSTAPPGKVIYPTASEGEIVGVVGSLDCARKDLTDGSGYATEHPGFGR